MGKCDIDVTQKKKGRFGQDSSFSLLRCVCQITGFLFFATLQKITLVGSSYTSILVVDRQIGNGVMDLMVSPSRFQSRYISLSRVLPLQDLSFMLDQGVEHSRSM